MIAARWHWVLIENHEQGVEWPLVGKENAR
jgi:hypothetical protein